MLRVAGGAGAARHRHRRGGRHPLGDTLYYGYAWFFRAFGLAVAAVAVVLYLRKRRRCTLDGARRSWRLLAVLAVAAVGTYIGLFWFTKYLGIWFG